MPVVFGGGGGAGASVPAGTTADGPALALDGTGLASYSQPVRDDYAPAAAPIVLAAREAEPPGEGRVLSGYYYHPVDSIFEQTGPAVAVLAMAEPAPPDPGAALAWPPVAIVPYAVHQFDPPPRPAVAAAEPPPPDPGSAIATGRSWCAAFVASMGSGFHVYSNGGSGPINYAGPIATLAATVFSYPAGALAPGTWMFGVRGFSPDGEEQNLDCAVTIVVSATSTDITAVPAAPSGLRALAAAAGALKVEWFYPPVRGPLAPTGFHVYCTAGPTVSYATPAATVAIGTRYQGMLQSVISGLTSGTAYAVAVRAFNAAGEEPNTVTVAATADAAGPPAVAALAAVAGV